MRKILEIGLRDAGRDCGLPTKGIDVSQDAAGI